MTTETPPAPAAATAPPGGDGAQPIGETAARAGSPPVIPIVTSIPPKLSRSDAGQPVGASYQKLCIQSWIDCGFLIFSVNHADEIRDLAPQYPQVTFIGADDNASELTGRKNPYLYDLLSVLERRAEAVVGIVNSDILLEPSPAWRSGLAALARDAVVVGQRLDTAAIVDGALQTYPWGFDYFFFDRTGVAAVLASSRAFAMGLPWWDYWLPVALALTGPSRRIVALERPAAMHLTHTPTYSWPLMRTMTARFVSFLRSVDRPASPPPAGLDTVVDRCRSFADLSAIERGELDVQITELVKTCAQAIGREVRDLEGAAGGASDPAPSGEPMSCATPAGAFRSIAARRRAGQLLGQALALLQQNRPKDAEPLLRAAHELAPRDADILFQLGKCLFSVGSGPAAAVALRTASELRPSDPAILDSLGVVLFALNRVDEAAACFEKALEVKPTYVQAFYSLAIALQPRNRHRNIVARFEKLLAAQPGVPDGARYYYELRRALHAKGAMEAPPAVEYFGQNGEDCLLDTFFGFKRSGFFVDVGAFDGIHLSNTYVFEKRGWSGICVEAARPYYEMCAANRPRSRCVHAACGAQEHEAVEFQFERGGLFSGTKVDAEWVSDTHARLGVPFAGFERAKVPGTTLDRLLGDGVREVDFISIDVEGAEIDVLAGCDLDRYRPRVLVIEANSQAEREGIDDYLAKRGYRLARSIAWNHFYVRSKQDQRALRAITVSAKLARPHHPSGLLHDRFGYPASPYVYWPGEA